MAFLRLSALVTSITGKLNGSYFSQKKGGTTVNRCGSKLTKADSGRTSLQRQQQILGTTAGSWRGLTNDERLAWQGFAGTLTWKNKAGMDYTPTGYEVFCSCNLNRSKIGLPPIVTPILSTGDGVIDGIAIDFSIGGALQLNYAGTTTTNNGIIIFASAPQSQGVNRPKGGYKAIYSVDTITAGITNLTTNYSNVFGYLPPAGSIFFKIEIVVADSGIQNGSKLTKADSGFL